MVFNITGFVLLGVLITKLVFITYVVKSQKTDSRFACIIYVITVGRKLVWLQAVWLSRLVCWSVWSASGFELFSSKELLAEDL